MKSVYKIISKESEVDDLISYCKTTGYACVDFETTGFTYSNPNTIPLMLGVSFQPGSSWIIPMEHKDSTWKGGKWYKPFMKFCREVVENRDIVKIAWNLKFEYKWFLRYGVRMQGRLFDGMLAKYCLDEERPHGLKEFVQNYFPQFADYEKKVDNRKLNTYPIEAVAEYCGIDCDMEIRAMIYLEGKLIKLGFYNLFRNLLMMASRFLAHAEFSGAIIDREYVESLDRSYSIKINEAEKKLRSNRKVIKYELSKQQSIKESLIESIKLEIREIKEGDSKQKERMINSRRDKIRQITQGKFTGKGSYTGMNFRSPQQLADFFFQNEHGLKFKSKFKTDKGGDSTSEDALKHYQKRDRSGFIEDLFKYRELTHLHSVYIAGVLALMDHNNRVHTNFHIAGTVTGRLSSTEPNLQNIPRDNTASDIKKMFVPPPGFVLVEVDYGQAELRVVAELAEDKAMIEIFKKNYNIHVATACKMNGGIEQYEKVKALLKDPEHPDFLDWERKKKRGKSLNFSILYLQGDKATAETLECSLDEAAKFKKEWFRSFPQVKPWIKNQIAFAHEHGYIQTPFGRKRRLHDIDSPKDFLRAEAERQSVNMPCQSISHDFALLSQSIIFEKTLTGELPCDMYQIYEVHDSIGFMVRWQDVHKVVNVIVPICQDPETEKYFGWKANHVKMKVSPEVGKNWGELRDYDPQADYSKLLIPTK